MSTPTAAAEQPLPTEQVEEARPAESADKKVWIHWKPQDQIFELARRIRPVDQFPQGKFYIKTKVQPDFILKQSYTWAPELDGPAEDIEPIIDITTYHTFGYHGFFKPSIGEVLTQIPDDFLGEVHAFEIVDWPQTVDDLNAQSEATNSGHHMATTRLYKKKAQVT